MNNRTLLPLSLIARRLRVPTPWLRAEADAGRVPAVRAGDQFLAVLEDIESSLLSRLPPPQAEAADLVTQTGGR